VYALEPTPTTYAVLRSNLEVNRVTNVTALCVAAGDNDGEGLLDEDRPGNTGASSIRPPLQRSTTIPLPSPTAVTTRRVDSVVPAADLARVTLVKVDVEGYELEALRGLETVFKQGVRPAIVVEVTPDLNREDAADFLAGFCARHVLKPYRFPDEGLPRAEVSTPFPLDLASMSNERQELLLAPA
jgi:FkbM family methyltransferase